MDAQDFQLETLMDAVEYFSNREACEQFVEQMRSPDGVECPYCKSKNIGHIKARHAYQCRDCRMQFTAKVGTIFEDSPLPLSKWLVALWVEVNCRNGISSCEVARHIGVTQKTAWFMGHRIRAALQAPEGGKLSGEIEVDETFIGGKARNMHVGRRERKIRGGTGVAGKTVVMGLLERHAKVKTQVVRNVRRKNLDPLVREHVESGSTVYTDALPSYESLQNEFTHLAIDHAEAYVRGNVHTNGLENYWSLLKRTLKGTYVSVEPFHLFRYLDEQAFRFNSRKATDGERFKDAVQSISGKRLTYQKLTGDCVS